MGEGDWAEAQGYQAVTGHRGNSEGRYPAFRFLGSSGGHNHHREMEGARVRRAVTPYRLTVGLLFALLTVVIAANGWGSLNIDIKPEVYVAPGRMLGQFLSAWTSTPYLGAANFNVGLFPVLLFTGALRGLGLGPEATFKILHLLLWSLGAWGTARLLLRLAPKAGRWAGLLAGVLFLANPYTVTAGATLAIALPMCLLPWLLYFFIGALRDPAGWRWPAAVALTFFAMSGMNVAVVPTLQLVMAIPILVMVVHSDHLAWRSAAAVVGKCAGLVLGVSLYWLVPGVAAITTGSQVVASSETLEGIARVSSFPEVLRGLGMWALYGRSDVGPWVPQHVIYVVAPGVIVLTMLWPTLALWSLRFTPRALTMAAAPAIALSAVVMVGLFPYAAPAPAGRAMAWAFANVPGLVAFRTTNKMGAVLVLSFALVGGVGLRRGYRWFRERPGFGPAAISAFVVLVTAWSLPALTGRLYISEFDVPQYWRDAAAAVDELSPQSRVLLLPGQTRPNYRWSVERPDDVTNSLFAREAIIPERTPSTSAPGANLLAALDDSVQSPTAVGSATSAFAHYLGAGNVLLRHDIVWENQGGARPGVTANLLANDAGLVGLANYGRPGQNTRGTAAPSDYNEALLPPLQLYATKESTASVRAESLTGSSVVAGDGWSVPQLVDAGLAKDFPLFQYAADVPADDLAQLLPQLGRLVLTDTNARRETVNNRLTAGEGSLRSARRGSSRWCRSACAAPTSRSP